METVFINPMKPIHRIVFVCLLFIGFGAWSFKTAQEHCYLFDFDEFLTVRVISNLESLQVAADAKKCVSAKSIVQSTLLEHIQAFKRSKGNSFLYYLLLTAWSKIFGYADIALRTFSILCFLIGALFFFLISQRFFNAQSPWPLLLLAIHLFNPFSLQMAVLIRCYSLAFALSMIVVYLILIALHSQPGIPLFSSLLLLVLNHLMAIPFVCIVLASLALFRWDATKREESLRFIKKLSFIALGLLFGMGYFLFFFNAGATSKLIGMKSTKTAHALSADPAMHEKQIGLRKKLEAYKKKMESDVQHSNRLLK
jgi:uncharacterized membrane protein